jgi:signal transduction histidine kinase
MSWGSSPRCARSLRGSPQTAGLDARVTIDLGGAPLDPDVKTIAYRIAQEALTNVMRHAGARTVAVDVSLDARTLRLIVTDDGRGVGDGAGEGYGIVGMRERAALATGELSIAPASGGGTRVTLDLPLG